MIDSPELVHTQHQADPTNRTLDTVHREIENVSDKLENLIKSEARLTNERFDSVAREFELIERGRTEQKRDTKEAVDAALVAQKTAVAEQTIASEKSINKSEAATAKAIDAQTISFTQSLSAMQSSFSDLKERVVVIEAKDVGQFHERNERRMSIGQITAFISATFLGLSLIVSAILLGTHH